MKIEQQIEINSYRFLLTLESKTVEAHSLMSDNKDMLQTSLRGYLDMIKKYPLSFLVKKHGEKTK